MHRLAASAAPAMAGCTLEPEIAIERQKPDRERFWGNADIAFAENDPISYESERIIQQTMPQQGPYRCIAV
jgi:hypothetical protein